MLPENIDDLFRQQLGGHATPPAPDLWARLQLPMADTDPVDAVFQDGLRRHATPPRRELWERLEDEHLRPQPRRRRVAAWWQYSAAAVLLLFLAAGGLLWRSSYVGGAGNGVAHQPATKAPSSASQPAPTAAEQLAATQSQPVIQSPELAATTPLTAAQKKNQDFFPTQATAPLASTSSTPTATTTRPRRAATAHQVSSGHQPQGSLPDAVASTLAGKGRRNTPSTQATTISSQALTPVLTPATHDDVAPALAVVVPAAAPAPPSDIILVEVRRSTTQPTPAPVAVAAVANAAPVPARRRGLRLGSLLRQADHLVHGEPVNLAEATGLPETVTVQARLGSRLVSKTIQL